MIQYHRHVKRLMSRPRSTRKAVETNTESIKTDTGSMDIGTKISTQQRAVTDTGTTKTTPIRKHSQQEVGGHRTDAAPRVNDRRSEGRRGCVWLAKNWKCTPSRVPDVCVISASTWWIKIRKRCQFRRPRLPLLIQRRSTDPGKNITWLYSTLSQSDNRVYTCFLSIVRYYY